MVNLKIKFVPHNIQKSDYDWADIELGDFRVGKARCLIKNDCFIIYSITIYPEYQGKGYGKKFVVEAKRHYDKIIADRVRYKAIGFWEKLDFKPDKDRSNWIYEKKLLSPEK